jgi:beta-lactamase regulating signal transducer with metallopeptidase domain/predicted  nucleic acid-binding Zn-ribbon protein
MLLLKASLLLSMTLLAARLLRRAPAAIRHRLWSFAFAALLTLPLLASVLPALHVPVPAGWRAPASLRTTGETFSDTANASDALAEDRSRADAATIADTLTSRMPASAARPERPRAGALLTARALLLTVWLTGTILAAAALILSLIRVRRLACTAEDVADPTWRGAADAIGTRLGLRRPARLLVSHHVGTPMAGGVWRPVIFLPASARSWSAERRDIVLAHELAHLAGCDPLRHVAARLAVALYWFHPLVLVAARQSSVAREQACDEAVLALGTRPSAYARVLLDLAESMHRSAPALAALPMVERSLLEIRLMAILNDDVRPAPRRRLLIPAIGVVLLTIAVSAAQPAVSPPAPIVAPAPAAMAITPPVPNVAATDVATAAAQANVGRDSACWRDLSVRSSFSGSLSTSVAGGRTVIDEQIGTRGGDRVIQTSFGDLRLCMVAEGAGDRDKAEGPSQWLGRARRVVMEARRGSVVQRLEVGRESGGGQRTSWTVGSAERPFDAAAQQWRDRMLAALDTTWELSSLRGEVSRLRGEISSIRGEESSLRGEISSLRGEVSSMRGRSSSTLGEASSLRGEISSIRGHISSLRGAISSENGAISSLNATRYGASESDRARIAARISEHDAEIVRIEREIRDFGADAKIAAVEQEFKALDADGKVAAIDAEIRAFDLDGKVAAVERRIAALDVEVKVAGIERRIEALDADRRGRQLEERRDSEIRQLEAAVAAVR